MIIATAGHVDHGKTSLVRALTGIDTDRLDEEKRRGLTIDLGFAYTDLGGDGLTGFVDVPGHERFVHNMVAGISEIDLALLVVAADDGPMPQTREHVSILELLGARSMAVVLSKIAIVSSEQKARAIANIASLLEPTRFAGAPVFEVDTPQGIGLDALREHLRRARAAQTARAPRGLFRMAIDRVFAVAGAGTVVTGAVLSGRAQIGDMLTVSTAGTPARVRSIHAHNQPAQEALAGQRCALNIAGPTLRREAISRGDWLVAPDAHAPTPRVDVLLTVLPDAPRALAHLAQVQIHLGAGTFNARVSLLDARSLPAGACGLARLIFDEPLAALHADRFVLRDPAAHRTLGGGRVIDPFPPERGSRSASRLAELKALSHDAPHEALTALLENTPLGVDLDDFERARNLSAAESHALRQRVDPKRIHAHSTPASREGRIGLSQPQWLKWLEAVGQALAQHHASHPDSVGPIESDLIRAATALRMPTPLRGRSARTRLIAADAIRHLIEQGQVVRQGARLRQPGHHPAMTVADQALLDRVVSVLRDSALRPPIVGELASGLGLERAELLTFLREMSHKGHLLAISQNRFFLPETLTELADIARQLAAGSAEGYFDAAAYRDASGIGRNLTIDVLEFLDRAGITRYAGERRSIIG